MSTVIRIKRRLEAEPLEQIIVDCKRQKTDNGIVVIKRAETVTDVVSTTEK